jgi:DNA-binding transcriptional LysR family regulator
MISNHGVGILKAAVGGEGIALLPEWGLKEELSTKQLQVFNLSNDKHRARRRYIFALR